MADSTRLPEVIGLVHRQLKALQVFEEESILLRHKRALKINANQY